MTAPLSSSTSASFAEGASVLELRAQSLAMRHREASARVILEQAINVEFQGQIALVSSFGAESAALLHLVSEIDPAIPIVFLDTQKHFAQTLSYRTKLATNLGLTNVLAVQPTEGIVAARDPDGTLWKSDPDGCCTLRKVEPLTEVLKPYKAWITGRKQFHGGGRVNLPAFEANQTHIKVNPLIRWSRDDVKAYSQKHRLPAHPLVAQGYPSIGCWPCTHPVNEDGDVRAGRWRGAAKTECGIHDIAK